MKVINKILILLFFDFILSSNLELSFSYVQVIDSLKELGYSYLDNNKIDSALIVSQAGIDYCLKTNNSNIFIFYNQNAEAYVKKQNIDKAVEIYNKAISERELYGITPSLADIYYRKGSLYIEQGKYVEAKKLYIEAKNLYEKFKEPFSLVQIRINLGIIESDFTDFQESIKNYNEALKILNDENYHKDFQEFEYEEFEGQIYHNLGVSYQSFGRVSHEKSDIQKALGYFKKARTIREELHDTSGIGSTLLCIAYNFLLAGQLSSAKSYLTEAANKIVGDLKRSTFFLIEGKIFAKEGNTKEALDSFLKSESLAVKNKGYWETFQAYYEIVELNSIPDSLKNIYKDKLWKIVNNTRRQSILAQKISVFYPELKTNRGEVLELGGYEWIIVSLISFVISLFLLILFLRKAKTISEFNLGNQYFYFLLIPAALASSAFLFGAMKSYATYKGILLGGELEMGGPVVLFILVIWLGFKFGKVPEPFDFTIHLQNIAGEINFEGSVIMEIGSDRKSEEINHKGSVDFKNIPASFRNKYVTLILNIDKYVFKNNSNITKCLLKGNNTSLTIKGKM